MDTEGSPVAEYDGTATASTDHTVSSSTRFDRRIVERTRTETAVFRATNVE